MSLRKMHEEYKQNRGSGGSGAENIAVQIDEFVFAEKNKANPEKDYVRGKLLHDAIGLKAEFDENNEPTTEVRVFLEKAEVRPDAKFARPELLDAARGSNKVKKTGPRGVMFFDKASVNRDGSIKAKWMRVAIPNLDANTSFALHGHYAKVDPERQRKDGNGSYQLLTVASTDNAVRVPFGADLKAAVVNLLKETAGSFGTAGFCFRVTTAAEQFSNGVEFFMGFQRDAEGKTLKDAEGVPVQETPEMAADRWFSDMKANPDDLENLLFVEFGKGAQNPDAVWELIPLTKIGTGRMSLPSAQDGRSDSYYFETSYAKKDGSLGLTHGYTRVIGVVQKMEGTTDYWFRTITTPISTREPVYYSGELPTQHVDPELVKILAEGAGLRTKDRNAARSTAWNERNAPAGETMQMGAPDPEGQAAGGMNPR